ncbi:MAG: Trm112 family protein [Geobacteraceae bacterium]|nr:Trm112 family protein [Geobacteraceae bacterium]
MALSEQLLQILVCPGCKEGVTPLEDESALLCARCGLKYPIRDGIPVMLIEEAEKLDGD